MEQGGVGARVVDVLDGEQAAGGQAGPVIIATLPENDEVVYLESRIKGQVLSRPDDVAEVRKHWEDILAEALPPTQSTELILEVADRWT